MSAAWSCLRIIGNVTPEVFFGAGLFGAQKGKGHADQCDMVIPPQPVAAFKVIQTLRQ